MLTGKGADTSIDLTLLYLFSQLVAPKNYIHSTNHYSHVCPYTIHAHHGLTTQTRTVFLYPLLIFTHPQNQPLLLILLNHKRVTKEQRIMEIKPILQSYQPIYLLQTATPSEFPTLVLYSFITNYRSFYCDFFFPHVWDEITNKRKSITVTNCVVGKID